MAEKHFKTGKPIKQIMNENMNEFEEQIYAILKIEKESLMNYV